MYDLNLMILAFFFVSLVNYIVSTRFMKAGNSSIGRTAIHSSNDQSHDQSHDRLIIFRHLLVSYGFHMVFISEWWHRTLFSRMLPSGHWATSRPQMRQSKAYWRWLLWGLDRWVQTDLGFLSTFLRTIELWIDLLKFIGTKSFFSIKNSLSSRKVLFVNGVVPDLDCRVYVVVVVVGFPWISLLPKWDWLPEWCLDLVWLFGYHSPCRGMGPVSQAQQWGAALWVLENPSMKSAERLQDPAWWHQGHLSQLVMNSNLIQRNIHTISHYI